MGALHEGHASLIERAVRENDLAVVSIFVNPTQFGPHEDFAAYPRDESADLSMCERLGAAMVFAPTVDEMYPAGDATRVQPGPIAARLEGAARPGHFAGAAPRLRYRARCSARARTGRAASATRRSCATASGATRRFPGLRWNMCRWPIR